MSGARRFRGSRHDLAGMTQPIAPRGIVVGFTFHPAAAQAIDGKGSALLSDVVKLEFPAQDQNPAFQSERIVSAAITDNEIIGEVSAWLTDVGGRSVFAFMRRNGTSYGFTYESYSQVEKLIHEILKTKWAQQFLGKAFIETTILEWCRASFGEAIPTALSIFLVKASEVAIKNFTMWAPISHLEIETQFSFGSVTISPMTAVFFDELETPSVESSPKQAEDIKALFARLRNDMQGGAAVVLKVEAEQSFVYEKGLALASDAVGLFRFLSPASDRFWLICPNALLGAQMIPYYNAIVLGDDGSFSNQSGVIPKQIGYWRLSTNEIVSMRSRGLTELSCLVSEEGLNEFQRRLRACVLTYTKGITFPDAADRLVYTCSSLESLLLRDTSEPIQQNLGERMAFLITKNPMERADVVSNVRRAYSIRSRYIHHRSEEIEYPTLNSFTAYAYAAFRAALSNMNKTKTPAEFIDAIDRIKFGG